MQSAGGYLSFLGFISRPIPALRLWAIKVVTISSFNLSIFLLFIFKIFGKLWEHSKEVRDRRFARLSTYTANWPSSLKKALQSFELRESTYLALMEVLLERISPTSLSPVLKEGEDETKTLMFKNPEFLAPIFELLCMGAQIDIQRRALQDFSALLHKVRIHFAS